MKKLFENFRKYTAIEELNEQFMILHEKQGNKLAKAQKELELIKKDPQAYIKQRTAKLQKKVGKAGGGKEGAGGEEVKDALLDKIKDQAGEQKQDVKKLQQLDKLGDQVKAQAQKDPEAKDIIQKLDAADKAITYILDLQKQVRDRIFKAFQDASKQGDQAKMQAEYNRYMSFGRGADRFIAKASEAFKKGRTDPKGYDEVVAMAKQFGFKG